jgi:hypothetical protein
VAWRVNVNGADVGTLAKGSYCIFEAEDSYLSFSVDEELTTGGILATTALTLILLPIGITNACLKAADRYLPLSPGVSTEARVSEFLLLKDGLAVVVTSESEWMSQTRELREVECLYSR